VEIGAANLVTSFLQICRVCRVVTRNWRHGINELSYTEKNNNNKKKELNTQGILHLVADICQQQLKTGKGDSQSISRGSHLSANPICLS